MASFDMKHFLTNSLPVIKQRYECLLEKGFPSSMANCLADLIGEPTLNDPQGEQPFFPVFPLMNEWVAGLYNPPINTYETRDDFVVENWTGHDEFLYIYPCFTTDEENSLVFGSWSEDYDPEDCPDSDDEDAEVIQGPIPNLPTTEAGYEVAEVIQGPIPNLPTTEAGYEVVEVIVQNEVGEVPIAVPVKQSRQERRKAEREAKKQGKGRGKAVKRTHTGVIHDGNATHLTRSEYHQIHFNTKGGKGRGNVRGVGGLSYDRDDDGKVINESIIPDENFKFTYSDGTYK